MSEYLLPNDSGLSIEDKRYIFEIRNRMIHIPANFSSDENENICISCKSIEDMNHVYSCRHWNNENEKVKYENIFTDNIHNQVIVYKRFKENYEKRERYTTEREINLDLKDKEKRNHVIPCDPLFSMSECSNGF